MKHNNKASKVSNLLKKHPDWSVAEMAAQAGCAANYVYTVRAKMRKNVLELTKDQEVPNKPPSPDKPSINAILDERATTYGHFYMQAELSQALKNTIMAHLIEAKKTLVADQQEALEMILTKIARITNGDSNYVDSWTDIAGYAALVADRLQGKVR
jgi:hypothetical protein